MDDEDDRELARKIAESYPRVGPPDPTAKTRLMARIRAQEASPRSRESGIAWLSRPVLAFASLALLAVGGVAGWILRGGVAPAPAPDPINMAVTEASSTREVRFVQFVLTAPRASRVTVVGDFNGWDPQATPMIRKEGGPWTAAVPVPPGRHVYAFVVDGERWVADPSAPMAPEDGFGMRNSVIVVGGRESI